MTTTNDPVQVRAIIAAPIRECWGPDSPYEHVAMRIIAALRANRIALVELPEPTEELER
ncbi:DNA methyltransferase [Mycobacterium phage MinionDave]|uniref:Uncharacterized protein n=1 Tax=Mycobacterium phage MinionDave TaxID=2653763 RepID=A0A5Q2WMT5_9CAUD|nr:DNA methyltransferase [Mycobacterium phage MinionDave]QGH78859.1 hypothetical protein SEA_MINIONDAVE_74 [Mycobacterium phage MinionDave]